MTTYPITMPSQNLSGVTISLDNVVSVSRSPFTKQQQAIKWGGQQWKISAQFPAMTRDTAEQWIAFMLSLDGKYGTFLAGDPMATGPRGVGGGSPAVKGAGQVGTSLLVDGAPNSTTGWLLKGDYFQIGTGANAKLYKLVEDANTNGSGEATLQFRPALRGSPADNALLTITDCRGVFRMVENEQSWSVDANQHYRISFEAEEAL